VHRGDKASAAYNLLPRRDEGRCAPRLPRGHRPQGLEGSVPEGEAWSSRLWCAPPPHAPRRRGEGWRVVRRGEAVQPGGFCGGGHTVGFCCRVSIGTLQEGVVVGDAGADPGELGGEDGKMRMEAKPSSMSSAAAQQQEESGTAASHEGRQ